jgi:hypothetical protein
MIYFSLIVFNYGTWQPPKLKFEYLGKFVSANVLPIVTIILYLLAEFLPSEVMPIDWS